MKSDLSNNEIADRLERHGRLLEIAGDSPFRTRAYSRAADAIRGLDEPITSIAAADRLRDIPGVGAAIAVAIEQLLTTGVFEDHAVLATKFPESIVELTTVPGIGPKTALRLFSTLGISSIDDLENALSANSIATASGLGSRIEATARDGLATLRRRTGRTLLAVALPIAATFITQLLKLSPVSNVSLAGAARRWDVTVGDLDFVVGCQDYRTAVAAICGLQMVVAYEERAVDFLTVTFDGGLRADVFLARPDTWGTALVRATGNARHLARLGVIPDEAPTEEAVYSANDLPWIPPELRAGTLEFERWQEIPSLVHREDVRGELHTHTTWSDGTASIERMAEAAANQGYDFLGITDHSHGLGVAGGLDVARLDDQRAELTRLNGAFGVELLAGAEVEVQRDGTLDFNDSTLEQLDLVVASLHTGLRQPGTQLTDRLVHVLHNPNVDIIAHPSGRLIERREGGDFDWDRVFEVASQTGTALEINASPSRLDLDPQHARRASEAGCLITINCDAHRPEGFEDMRYGIAMARRAWLTPGDVLNCWPRDRVDEWLAKRGRRD